MCLYREMEMESLGTGSIGFFTHCHILPWKSLFARGHPSPPPSCLNLNSQGEASLLLLGETVVSSRSLPSSSMDFPGLKQPSLHLPVGSSWSISPNVQGASSHCALKAAKALLMIIRYSSVSPDHMSRSCHPAWKRATVCVLTIGEKLSSGLLCYKHLQTIATSD